MKPLLVIGGGGQLANAFKELCPDAIFLDRTALDLAHPHTVTEALEQHHPRAVINAAAYTQVDKAETEERLAHRVNSESPAAMAIFCAERQIPLVHFSTDYVFDGRGDAPWHEDDSPSPINAYGRSKLEGEDAIEQVGGKFLILRTSWVYDATGKNFLNTILRLMAEREELRVIDDQFGAPTYAPHLAKGTLKLLMEASYKSTFESGVYHLCNAGVTTWCGFAVNIAEQARRRGMPLKVKSITPIPTEEYPTPAKRPHNSRLDCGKALSMFGVSLPDWQQGLSECMERKA